jgi:hypothetical protein
VIEQRARREHPGRDGTPSATAQLRPENEQEQHAEERQEELRPQPLRRHEVLGHPRRDGAHGKGEAQAVEPRPVLAVGQVECAHHEQGVVGEQRELRVGVSANQKRRQEAATHRHHGQPERPLSIGQRRRARRDQDQEAERRGAPDEPIEAVGGIHREEKDGDAATGQNLPVRAIPSRAEAATRDNQGRTGAQAEHDPHRFGDPLVVEGVLQEERDAEHQDDRADPEHQPSADGLFERRRFPRGRGGSSGAVGRRYGPLRNGRRGRDLHRRRLDRRRRDRLRRSSGLANWLPQRRGQRALDGGQARLHLAKLAVQP